MGEVIYAMVDPRDNLEFYVGRTQDVYQRFVQHIKYQDRNKAKNARIQELKSLHLLPVMKTLEIVEDSALAGEREAYWIRHFRYLGIILTNDIVYTEAYSESPKRRHRPRVVSSGETKVVRTVRRILQKRPDTKASELATKVGISESYAQKLKAKLGKETA